MKKLLFASIVLATMAASPALAADPGVPMEEAPVASAFFGFIEGSYLFDEKGGGTRRGFLDGPQQNAGDGWGGAAHLGYRFSGPWDVSVRGRIWNHGEGEHFGVDPNEFAVSSSDGFHVDGQIGYTANLGSGTEIRGFAGIRYLQWKQEAGFFPDAPLGCCGIQSDTDGLGPVVGFDFEHPFTDKLSLIGGAELAVLFGERSLTGGPTTVPAPIDDSETFYHLSGTIGAQYNFTENLGLAAGYRADLITDAVPETDFLDMANHGESDVLNHTIFARLSFKFAN